MKKFLSVLVPCLFVICFMLGLVSCNDTSSSDDIQKKQQETMLQEATAQTGMPAVINWRERKLLKQIIELRDQKGLVTYLYTKNEMTGKFRYVGKGIGFPIPYSTQYTNPQKIAWASGSHSHVLPQADPNGLFSPASAEGTWILMEDPETNKVFPVYFETRMNCSPFKFPDNIVEEDKELTY